jgi:hypothetical protein
MRGTPSQIALQWLKTQGKQASGGGTSPSPDFFLEIGLLIIGHSQ